MRRLSETGSSTSERVDSCLAIESSRTPSCSDVRLLRFASSSKTETLSRRQSHDSPRRAASSTSAAPTTRACWLQCLPMKTRTSQSSFANTGIDGQVTLVPGLGLRTTSFRMTSLDWEIVRLLLRDAERKMDEIAKVLRVSTRTVKRRLNMMMEDARVFAMPIVELRRTEVRSYQLR